jgi:hypothetical protein
MLLVLAGCGPLLTIATPTPTSTARATTSITSTPTAPAISAGTVLYHTDWSQGLAGWSVPAHINAQSSQGRLRLTCTSYTTLTLNYRPTISNYTLEFAIQVLGTTSDGGTFVVSGASNAKQDGYTVGAASLESRLPYHGQIEAYITPQAGANTFYTADFSPGTQWLSYRIDIQENTATLSINGVHHGQVLSDSTSTLSQGPLTLSCGDITMNVGALSILAL